MVSIKKDKIVEVIEGNDLLEIADKIVYEYLDYYFGVEDDQVSKEMLKDKDFTSYVKQIKMCYGNKGKVCSSLNKLSKKVNKVLNTNDSKTFNEFLNVFNEEISSLGYKDQFVFEKEEII